MTRDKDDSPFEGDAPKPREAYLRWSVRGRHWSANPVITKLILAGGVLGGYAIFGIGQKLLGSPVAGLMGLIAFTVALIWWLWIYWPRRVARQQHEAVLGALTEKLPAVRFEDGSISDFSPTGGILLSAGGGLAFDAVRLLGRSIMRPGAGWRVDIDWIWSMEDFRRLEVCEVPVRGWRQRLRTMFGLKPRMRTALSAFNRKDEGTVDWPIAPGYEAAADKLAATLSRKLANRDGAEAQD